MSESSSKDTEKPEAAPSDSPRRRWRWGWVARLVLLLVGAPVVMAVVAAVLLVGREVAAPSWVVREVEARAEQLLAGGSLDFGEMRVAIGDDLHPRLVLRNTTLRDANGEVLARVPRVEGLISPRGALQGRVLAQEVRLFGAQISLRRGKDGRVALAFEQGREAVGNASGFLGLLEQLDAGLEAGALEALEQVTAEGLIINFVDGRAGRSWVVDGGRIALDLREGQTTLRANVALLSGRSFVTTAEMTYTSQRGTRAAQVGFSITDAAAADIASQSPALAWLGVLDAPISGALRAELNEQGRLNGISATLQIARGEVRPTATTQPVPFESARTYLRYDPDAEKLEFDLIEVDSDWGRLVGAGRSYLREMDTGWPGAFLGQLQLSELHLTSDRIYEQPVTLTDGSLDFRLRLDPFTLDIGQAVVVAEDGTPLRMAGQVLAAAEGWAVSADLEAEEINGESVLALWPGSLARRTRVWIVENIDGALYRNLRFAIRTQPGVAVQTALTTEFSGAQVRYMRDLPPIEGGRGRLSILGGRFALSLDAGEVTAPEGGRLALAGSTMVIPRIAPGAPARFDLAIAGRITAAMSILSQPPFNGLQNSDLPVSFAQGRVVADVSVDTPLGPQVTPVQRQWRATARLRDLRSERLVPGQVITASALRLALDRESLVVRGPARMGDVAGDVTFSRALGPGSEGTARLQAEVDLGPAFLSALNIRLPDGMVEGNSRGQLALDLSTPEAPVFRLTSDLQGTALALSGLGWRKGRGASGALTVAGVLGATPRIDEFSLNAPGLQASGTVQLADGGGLARAAFDRVRIGNWLEAPVVLVGRGPGQPVGIQVAGGVLDLRDASFGGSGDGRQGGPIEIALDRLQITDGIALEGFRGVFSDAGGLQGDFSGQLNGAAPVSGTLVPVNGRPAVRVQSNDAGAVLRAAGLFRRAIGGAMVLTLLPAGTEGSYDGTVQGQDLRVQDAPALASLLDAISVVGLLTQLDGQGIMFSDIEAQFRLTPNQIIVTQSSAVGPGLGLSLDGIYATGSRTMDFQGVVSPFYLLNGVGAVLTRPGEGLIGFNFNLRGPVDNPQVVVNPLSALTPGMFREIFRRPPPTVSE